ncbi:DUF397 domain-containing protein [Sphaerisporangium sp. TRM90804]|nr:DUF397 domain-containing protein [Sphaerisporangium sp. TRM90804]MDH2430682.1 DUF397 domain-containing protein [Sphaerisporangium sp. TRM90804]
MNDELRDAAWRKSSRSGSSGGNCVEVARLPGGRVGVRDSKRRTGPALILGAAAWRVFSSGLKQGRFDG